MQAGRTFLEAAKVRGDHGQRLIVSLSDEDPIAMELRYHWTCCRMYTNTKQKEVIRKNQEGKHNAFQARRTEMEPNIFESLEVLPMSDFRQRYVEPLSFQDMQNPLYRSESKRRITAESTEIVYYDEVLKGLIIE